MKNWVVGNWKMNGSLEMAADFVPALLDGLLDATGWEQSVRVGLCPPFPYLRTLAQKCKGYALAVGAQNVHAQAKGAFTGEVSAPMLADLGVDLCIVGHSERRQYNGETDEAIREKVLAVVQAGLTPILCVGETLQEREAGRQAEVVERQLAGALKDIAAEDLQRLVVAYEPVWAIGTGVTATPEQAGEMHAHIRGLLQGRLPAALANEVPLLYGGSVNPDNAAALMAQPEINGTLVGGASLKPETFVPIIKQSLS